MCLMQEIDIDICGNVGGDGGGGCGGGGCGGAGGCEGSEFATKIEQNK